MEEDIFRIYYIDKNKKHIPFLIERLNEEIKDETLSKEFFHSYSFIKNKDSYKIKFQELNERLATEFGRKKTSPNDPRQAIKEKMERNWFLKEKRKEKFISDFEELDKEFELFENENKIRYKF